MRALQRSLPRVSLVTPAALLGGSSVPDLVEVPARSVVAIDGAGGPERDSFEKAATTLRWVTAALQLARAARGRGFLAGPRETLWWVSPPPRGALVAPRETWRWRVRIAVPDDVTEQEVAAAIASAAGEPPPQVKLEHLGPELMGRVLHDGPLEDAPRSFASLRNLVEAHGLVAPSHFLQVRLDSHRTMLLVDLL